MLLTENHVKLAQLVIENLAPVTVVNYVNRDSIVLPVRINAPSVQKKVHYH